MPAKSSPVGPPSTIGLSSMSSCSVGAPCVERPVTVRARYPSRVTRTENGPAGAPSSAYAPCSSERAGRTPWARVIVNASSVTSRAADGLARRRVEDAAAERRAASRA